MPASILDHHRSPVSRHPTAGRLHWLTYSIHDMSSIGFLVSLIGQDWIGSPWLAPALLALSVVSGAALITYRRQRGSSRGHLTSTSVVTSVVVNQGLAIAILGWWLFSPEAPATGRAALLAGLIAAHAVYAGARAFRLLVSERRKGSSYFETTAQLLYMVALPNTAFFAAFAAGAWSPADASLIVTLLVFEGAIGLAFSIAHDRTWLWREEGISRWKRDAVCLLPYGWLVVGFLA
jgi:hypothetical protein